MTGNKGREGLLQMGMAATQLKPIRVLVVGDGASAAEQVELLLRRERCHAEVTAVSAAQAADYLREGLTDVLVVDAEAAGATGTIRAISELVEKARNLFGVPAVVLTETDPPEAASVPGSLAGEAYASVPRSRMEQLPKLVARASEERSMQTRNHKLERELEHVHSVMRDNQKLITIGRLAGSIAHEINNPLESVVNLIYLLNDEKGLSPQGRSFLNLAQRELDRVVQISKQTLNFYRETPTPVRMEPRELLEEVLVLYSRRIMEKRINVIRQYDCHDAVTVFPGEMRQVFSNLIANALEATGHGGMLRVRIRRARVWNDSNVTGLRISIGDTGVGIAKDVRARLGEPFFTTKGQRGTGLGLWVTQTIVQRYGGNLQLSSHVGPEHHGTVFTVFLPTNLRPAPVLVKGLGDTGEADTREAAAPVQQMQAGDGTAEERTWSEPNVHEMRHEVRRISGE